MIPISKPVITNDEIKAVINVLKSGIIASGPKVKEFEENLKKFLNVNNVIATSNGTSALHSALFGFDIKRGDKVITPSFTFIATANSILHCGAEPIFADIKEETFNIDPDSVENILKKDKKKKIKAIIVVHLYGRVCEMPAFINLAKKYKLLLIEDAAQAHGAKLNGKMAGTFGDVAAFSLYATKNITTAEGGFIALNNNEIAAKIRSFINHGQKKVYYHTMLGYNYRMTDIEAAIGIVQLQKLDEFNEKRRKNANKIKEILKNYEWVLIPEDKKNEYNIYHQFTIRVNKKIRDKLLKSLNESGIGAKIFYPIPIHKQPFYKKILQKNISLPVTEKVSLEVISLPVHPLLDERYFSLLNEVFSKFSRSI
ncbi:MAG: DegT/DnrJ/EryC1/StrS family aminotransferase [Candidatus Omnitrophica bacterium]|nr:DegT/DnrJ/EryC1/StrS family aminotransferase [Candidatus Omnitrophota bacterium]